MGRFNKDDDRVIIERATGSTVGMLMAGLAIGAGLALLLAPQSGDETRQIIRRKARKARRVAGGYADDLRDRASEVRDRAGRLVDTTKARGRDMVEHTRDAVDDRIDDTRRAISEKRRELSRAVEEGRAAARDAKEALESRLADAQVSQDDGASPDSGATAS
ncbi:MAG: YtxH domain-containing protein [Gemmatimonadaceae bacterium]